MAWRVHFERGAEKEFDALGTVVQQRIHDALKLLAIDPRRAANVARLVGTDLFRLRVGDYRVVYALRDETLVIGVVKVAHRREVYRR